MVFSGAAESHTLDPTSMATQGAGGFEFTGSNTAVHPDPRDTEQWTGMLRSFQNLWTSQKVIPETKKERPSNGTSSKSTGSFLPHTF